MGALVAFWLEKPILFIKEHRLFSKKKCVIVLRIDNLHVTINETPVLKGVTLVAAPSSVHAVMGPNGSGKSTLARALMGDPDCVVTAGSLQYYDTDILTLSPDKRAQLGLFLAFQNPCVIPGVSVFALLYQAYQACKQRNITVTDFKALLAEQMAFLGIDQSLSERGVNEGFSGGEKKKLELLQLLVLKPSCIMLDEIDSGLDIDALKLVASVIDKIRTENPSAIVIFITHNPRLQQYLKPEHVHIISHGVITRSGDAALVDTLEQKGYHAFTSHNG